VAAVAGVSAPPLLLPETVSADENDDVDSARRARSYRIRLRAAAAERNIPLAD
jgi:hypothetical protein